MHPAEATLDHILSLQLSLAWAGEAGADDGRRLGWWQTDLVDEYGGGDLLKRLVPRTARWAALEAAREAAKQADARLRLQSPEPHRLLTLFYLGFALDERLAERLAEHRRGGRSPQEALPGLFPLETPFRREDFARWLRRADPGRPTQTPNGLLLPGLPPEDPSILADHLASALASLPSSWLAPHYRSRA